MEVPTSSRGNKRACTSHTETEPRTVPSWLRMCNKLRVQEHLDTTVKLAMGLAIPLMSRLMRVLAMMTRVADMEEVETLQSVMQQMVLEKRQQEKGHKGLTKETMQMHKDFKPNSRKKSNSTGSFSVVTAETLDTT